MDIYYSFAVFIQKPLSSSVHQLSKWSVRLTAVLTVERITEIFHYNGMTSWVKPIHWQLVWQCFNVVSDMYLFRVKWHIWQRINMDMQVLLKLSRNSSLWYWNMSYDLNLSQIQYKTAETIIRTFHFWTQTWRDFPLTFGHHFPRPTNHWTLLQKNFSSMTGLLVKSSLEYVLQRMKDVAIMLHKELSKR